MKTQIILGFLLAMPLFAQGSTQSSHSSLPSVSADLVKVRALAQKKVSGSDVRLVTSVYTNTDGNPCVAAGVSYVVDVEIRHSERAITQNGQPTQARKWDKFNQYWISADDLHNGQDLDDSVCMEE